MIAKGNLHADGQKLALYLITGKGDERAELIELRGFASDNIFEAFRDVEIQSEATRCEKPFFHAQVRLPDHEALDREKWLFVADRIEQALGFEGQGRAVAFHHDDRTGETHMHIAWSRIDLEEMRAIDPGLYKNKLKEVCRELEIELGLTRLDNERPEDQKTLSAARPEYEQSRRLGTDLKAIREDIRECWDRSDNGKSFAAALEEKGYILARGDRRDFVVVDHAGGDHALAKRITGATAAQTRARLVDIDKANLTSVNEAKEIQADRATARDEMEWEDRLAAAAIGKEVKVERDQDTVRDEIKWEDELAKAAIAKEEREKNLVPDEKAVLRISEALVKRDLAYHEQQAARPMTTTEKRIANAAELAMEGYRLTDTLAEFGIMIARATAEDVKQLGQERAVAFATDEERYIPRVREGELVAVNDKGEIWTINPHRIDVDQIAAIATNDGPLPSVASVREASSEPEREAGPYVSTTLLRSEEEPAPTDLRASPDKTIDRMGTALTKSVVNAIGGLSKIFSGEGEPNPDLMSPEQRAAYRAELALRAGTREANQPTQAEIEWREAVAKAKRAEAAWELGREQREKDRDQERWRERERER